MKDTIRVDITVKERQRDHWVKTDVVTSLTPGAAAKLLTEKYGAQQPDISSFVMDMLDEVRQTEAAIMRALKTFDKKVKDGEKGR